MPWTGAECPALFLALCHGWSSVQPIQGALPWFPVSHSIWLRSKLDQGKHKMIKCKCSVMATVEKLYLNCEAEGYFKVWRWPRSVNLLVYKEKSSVSSAHLLIDVSLTHFSLAGLEQWQGVSSTFPHWLRSFCFHQNFFPILWVQVKDVCVWNSSSCALSHNSTLWLLLYSKWKAFKIDSGLLFAAANAVVLKFYVWP